ncbi:MAG: hypothetical protein AB7V50_04295 [Vampirovibrionia bacterium]
MHQNSFFDNVLEKIFELPLWVKQAIFVELKEHIEKETPIGSLESLSKHNLLQLYTPFITPAGKKALNDKEINFNNKSHILNEDVKALLKCAENKNRIIDICQQNNWTISKTCNITVDCIARNLIEPINSNTISSTVNFLAGKIRIGEFLVRTGKITVEQLDMALYSQKYTENTLNERIYLAQILLNLNYISRNDYENILFLKEYGNELYTMKFNNNITNINENINNLKNEIASLKSERVKLRENISKFSDDAHTVAKLLEKIDLLQSKLNDVKQGQSSAQIDLNCYIDELVSLNQENMELREQLEKYKLTNGD